MPSLIPRPIVEFTPPSRPEDLSTRLHNKYAKEALRETLDLHWSKNTRKHFQLGARQRYGYAPRSVRYNLFKKRWKGHTIEMLLTGRSRQQMSSKRPQIRVGGAAEGGKKGLSGYYFLRFPFSGDAQFAMRKRARRIKRAQWVGKRQNKLPQLRKEMERWAGDEVQQAKEEFANRYMAKVNAYRGRRQRKRMPRK
jgi:hypothetical protein